MRIDHRSPAGQLRSVSARYTHPLAHSTAAGSASPIPSPQKSSGPRALSLAAAAAWSEMATHAGEVVMGGSNRVPPSQSGLKFSHNVAMRRPSRGLTLDPSVPVERDESLCRLEAVLLVAKEPLPPRKLSKFANLAGGKEALTLVSRLNHLYDRSARAFRVEEVAGGWQLRSRPQFATWLRKLQHVPSALRLSSPAMETLAAVAYRQPVVRVDIEAVRGVACGEILRQLMERDLVRVAGRSEELGRPYLYSTTKYFLQAFGLRDLEELPRADWFRKVLEEETQTEEVDDLEDELDEDEDDEEDDE